MPFRDDLDALAARHASLESEVSEKTRERDAAKSMLDEARARAKLPVLDNIRVASPCRADWAQMVGDDRVRACGECNQNVYNLSSMTRDEAEALLQSRNGRLCVRYFQRHDGTILLADCVVGKKRRRRRVVIAAGIASAVAGSGALAWQMNRSTRVELVDEHTDGYVMGAERVYPAPQPVMGGSASSAPIDPAALVPPTHTMGAVVMQGDVSEPPPPPHAKMGKIHRVK